MRSASGTTSTPATVVAGSSDPEQAPPAQAEPPGWLQAIAALQPSERLAGLGALVCAGSTLLPWYRAPVEELGKSAWGAFGFALLALLITVGAALVLLMRVGRGRRPPLPLHEGTLLAAAGIWAGLLTVWMIFDRPEFDLAGFEQEYRLGYGAFVSLGGAALLTLAGLRIRRWEPERDRQGEARTPSDASLPRSAR
jgi:hypothetical protein